jgi:hypothetical protein
VDGIFIYLMSNDDDGDDNFTDPEKIGVGRCSKKETLIFDHEGDKKEVAVVGGDLLVRSWATGFVPATRMHQEYKGERPWLANLS